MSIPLRILQEKRLKLQTKQYECPVRIWIRACNFLLPHMRRKRFVIEQTQRDTTLRAC